MSYDGSRVIIANPNPEFQATLKNVVEVAAKKNGILGLEVLTLDYLSRYKDGVPQDKGNGTRKTLLGILSTLYPFEELRAAVEYTNGNAPTLVTGRLGKSKKEEIEKMGATVLYAPPYNSGPIYNFIKDLLNPNGKTQAGVNIVHASAKMAEIMEISRVISAYDDDVLITGDTGVGKELVACYIQEQSKRSGGPFVRIDLRYINPDMIGNELFGHERGAYTGANNRYKGIFEQADHGTLLLDEVGNLPLGHQDNLLRVLEGRSIRRLHGSNEIPLDFRVIATSNQNLWKLVEENKFKGDLYHRLNILSIHIPPLNERKEDIEPLVRYFWKYEIALKHPGLEITDGAISIIMKQYQFPGNVRQLRNLLLKSGLWAKIKGTNVDEGVIHKVIHEDKSFF